MNRILLILLLPLSAVAQTTYPVLSTTTARTIVGGITNLPHLNSNNVFTGTGRWTGAVTLTNSGNVFAGDGSGLTGVAGGGILTSNGLGTNLVLKPTLGTTNFGIRIYGSNHSSSVFVTDNARLQVPGVIGFSTSSSDYLDGPAVYSYSSQLTLLSGSGQNIAFNSHNNSTRFVDIRPTGHLVVNSSAGMIGFNVGGGADPDSAFARNSAGVIEVNNGTAGQYRDIITRSSFTTNLYATNLVLNGGATVTGILSATASLNFDLTALTVEDKTMTVTGAAVGDIVTLGVPNGSVTTSVQYTAWVSAADTVTVRARTSATGEDPASGTFRATVIKH